MDRDILALIGATVFGIFLIAVSVFISLYMISVCESETVTEVIEINSTTDITITNNKFFIKGPEGKQIEITPDSGEMFDFTKNSKVYVQFSKQLPFLIYDGNDWKVDGIVKVDTNENI